MTVKRARLETAVWGGKLVMLCVGIVSTMVSFKVAIIPYLVNLTFSTIPHLWSSIRTTTTSTCSLSPLYMYIILNSIIIIIAASSAFQNQNNKQSSSSSVVPSSADNISNAKTSSSHDRNESLITEDCIGNKRIMTESSLPEYETAPLSNNQFSNEMTSWHDLHTVKQPSNQEEDQETIFTMSTHATPTPTSTEPSSLEDSCLTEDPGKREPEEDHAVEENTLDTTWTAIMEKKGRPICKQLKKSDTWNTPTQPVSRLARCTIIQAREVDDDDHLDNNNNTNINVDDRVAWARRELKKSDTFSNRVSTLREKSMTQEELNQRSEAFINKINNQIRLQRLESVQRALQGHVAG